MVHLDVNNSGVFNNSSGSCATRINGASGSYTVDTSFQFVSGGYCSGAGNNQLNPVQTAGQLPYPPVITLQPPVITCSGNGSSSYNSAKNTYTFTPGNYPSGITLNSTGNIIFNRGKYCFGGNVKLGGTADIRADNVSFLITNGEFSTNGTSTLTCNDMMVHINRGYWNALQWK